MSDMNTNTYKPSDIHVTVDGIDIAGMASSSFVKVAHPSTPAKPPPPPVPYRRYEFSPDIHLGSFVFTGAPYPLYVIVGFIGDRHEWKLDLVPYFPSEQPRAEAAYAFAAWCTPAASRREG